MVSEADEAAGLTPGNEENEADRCFSPEKPRLPLSIEGINFNKKPSSCTGGFLVYTFQFAIQST